MTFNEWLKTGIDNNWVGPPVCYTHDGLPTTAEEDEHYDLGDEPCLHILRCYPDPETRSAVEANHTPSKWRNPHRTNP